MGNIPPALKSGIYSGMGRLPTENPAKFRKFKQQVFAELVPVGRVEEGIVEHIACLLWRRQNLFTYCLANRARNRHSSIYSKLSPPDWPMPLLLQGEPETRSPEELAALHKCADEQARDYTGRAQAFLEQPSRFAGAGSRENDR